MHDPHQSQSSEQPVAHENTAPTKVGTPGWLLPASILGAAVLISGSLIYTVMGRSGIVAAPAPAAGDPPAAVAVTAPAAEERDVILGKADAPVSIVAYEDFQCPFCAQYHEETEKAIRTAYVDKGQAKTVFRHFAFLGPESTAAAAASECAKDQGKFWEYHDALFAAESADGRENNGNLSRTLFMKLAKDIGLDEGKFGSCVDAKTHDAFVASQTKEGTDKYGVQSTPTVFVNDQKVEGAYPFATFQGIIDGILNQ